MSMVLTITVGNEDLVCGAEEAGHQGQDDDKDHKAAETVSQATRGYDAGKKINGRKRHLVIDTRGLAAVSWPSRSSRSRAWAPPPPRDCHRAPVTIRHG